MNKKDREFAGITHLVNIVPLWGLVFNGVIWYIFKDKSKYVVFNAIQSIFFHLFFLTVMIIGIAFQVFIMLIKLLLSQIGSLLEFGNWTVMMVFFTVYILTCILGAWRIFNGEDFLYPFIGKRLTKEFSTKEEE